MNYLETYEKDLSRQTVDVFQDVMNEYIKIKPQIKQLIKDRWLLGKRPDGSLIGEYRSISYAYEKNQQNSRAGLFNVDLIDTGDLVNQITLALTGSGIEIISIDSKFNKIADKYGDDNFNITDAEQEQIEEMIFATIIQNKFEKLWQ